MHLCSSIAQAPAASITSMTCDFCSLLAASADVSGVIVREWLAEGSLQAVVVMAVNGQPLVAVRGDTSVAGQLRWKLPANATAGLTGLSVPAGGGGSALWCPQCRVHAGFQSLVEAAAPLVHAALQGLGFHSPVQAVFVTGTGSGGPVAALLGLHLLAQGWHPVVYTSRAPAFGDVGLAFRFHEGYSPFNPGEAAGNASPEPGADAEPMDSGVFPLYRVVYGADPLPHTFMDVDAMSHVGTEVCYVCWLC
jgi:hypothetical protein